MKLAIEVSRFAKGLRSGFLIFPQNGVDLLALDEYLAAMDGVGKEDTWFLLNERRSPGEVQHDLELLRLARSRGKLVLVVDYPTDPDKVREFFDKALAEGFVPYVGPLDLDRVGYFKPP